MSSKFWRIHNQRLATRFAAGTLEMVDQKTGAMVPVTEKSDVRRLFYLRKKEQRDVTQRRHAETKNPSRLLLALLNQHVQVHYQTA